MRDKTEQSNSSYRYISDEMNGTNILKTDSNGKGYPVAGNCYSVSIDNITKTTNHEHLDVSSVKKNSIYKSERNEHSMVIETENDAVNLTSAGIPLTKFSETNHAMTLNFPGLPTTNNESDVIECFNGQTFSNSIIPPGANNQGFTTSQFYENRPKVKVTQDGIKHCQSELMSEGLYLSNNGCEQQNGIMKERNYGKQNIRYDSDLRDEKLSETSQHQDTLDTELVDRDCNSVESEKGKKCEMIQNEKINLPCLKRRIWSPSKTPSGVDKYSGDIGSTFIEKSEDFENLNVSESEYEPKKRRRKQLHPDKNMAYPFWGDTHQPFIEFDNTRMFLKFRKEPKPFRCAECDIVFSSESDLISHMVSHKSDISDKQEVEKGDNQNDDNENNLTLTVTKFETKVGLSGEDLLRMHKETENKMTKCQYCNVTFPSKKGVEKHISFKHKDKIAEAGYGSSEPLVCVLCGKILKTKYSLKKHWQVHSESKDFKCTICDKGFAYRRSLEMHVKGHEYAKQFETQGHVKVQSNIVTNISEKDTLEVEGTKRLKIDLNEDSERILEKSSDSDVYITKRDVDGKKVYQCVACMKSFDSEPLVIEHAGNGCTFKKNKPQKCPVCNKVLKTSVADHIRIHTGERPYECPICGKMFKRGYHLQIHQQTAHSDEKPWHCDEPGCGKSFKRKDKLQCHKRTHSSEKPYVCLDCGNSYKQSHHLSRHRRRMHDKIKTKSKMENVEDEIRNELVCVDFNGMEQFIREAYDNDDKTGGSKGNGFKDDSNESWDMSKQIAETISNISEKDDS